MHHLKLAVSEHCILTQSNRLKIDSIESRRTPLPITEIGDLSWFTVPALVQESGGPVAIVLQWLDAEAAGPAWAQAEIDRQQLSLFCWAPPTKRGQPLGWPLRRSRDVPPYSAAVISGV